MNIVDDSRRVAALDSTLRDGAQSEGISFSVADKLAIAAQLDRLGVRYIEAGLPYSNPKDAEFFSRAGELHLKNARLTAFGATCRPGVSAADDDGIRALIGCGTPAVSIFGKACRSHVYDILGADAAENMRMITDSCRAVSQSGREVLFDAEHFFTGWAEDRQFALDVLAAAAAGGARTLVLCDTTGGVYPDEAKEITAAVCERFRSDPDITIGIHMHNDNGMAVANTVVSVLAGAAHIQGTLLGIGERCGNAQLAAVIADLQLTAARHAGQRFEMIPDCSLLTSTARAVAEICNTSIKRHEPYIGNAAFAHKAGVHADSVLKRPDTYEQIEPEQVGNSRRILISEVAGRGALLHSLRSILPDTDKQSPEVVAIMDKVKQLEHEGYRFEGANASLELMARRCLGQYTPSFELCNFRILCTDPHDPDCSAAAMVKVRVGGNEVLRSAEGQGPVNALDKALRLALMVFFPSIAGMRLTDYKVRVMDSRDATAARVRVSITSSDGKREWSTVGVSSDIIEASFSALCDSVEYYIQGDAAASAQQDQLHRQ